MMRFKIGDVTATLVQETIDKSFDFLKFFPLATAEAVEENLSTAFRNLKAPDWPS